MLFRLAIKFLVPFLEKEGAEWLIDFITDHHGLDYAKNDKRGQHMNFLALLPMLLKLIPYVVAGIETIHKDESTETKTQIAQELLTIAKNAAEAELPGDTAAIEAVEQVIADGIGTAQTVVAAIKSAQAPAATVAQVATAVPTVAAEVTQAVTAVETAPAPVVEPPAKPESKANVIAEIGKAVVKVAEAPLSFAEANKQAALEKAAAKSAALGK